MIKHVLVGADFSPAWEPLRGRLGRLRAWGVERVTLVHVLVTRYPAAPAVTHQAHYEQRLDELVQALKSVGLEAAAQVRVGGAARELLAAAHEFGADAVLVGERGDSARAPNFLGGAALELLGQSTLPVWLEPVDAAADESRILLLATDGSAAAAGAEQLFRELLPRAERGLAISAVYPGRADESVEAARQHLQRFAGSDTRVLEGDARDVIVATAREEQAGLVVLGKRGRGMAAERLFGSTAEAVCRRAECPVLLVPE